MVNNKLKDQTKTEKGNVKHKNKSKLEKMTHALISLLCHTHEMITYPFEINVCHLSTENELASVKFDVLELLSYPSVYFSLHVC